MAGPHCARLTIPNYSFLPQQQPQVANRGQPMGSITRNVKNNDIYDTEGACIGEDNGSL